MDKMIINSLRENLCTPFMTVIGRNGAGVPIMRVEAIYEFDNEAVKSLFRKGIEENRVVKTLLDENKIKSIIILDSGEIHPSTFHYVTLRNRCLPYVTLVTTVGGDKGGVNVDKINLIINYKNVNRNSVIQELIGRYEMTIPFDDIERTKSLMLMDSQIVYPCTFNYSTIRRRIYELRGDEKIPDEEDEEESIKIEEYN